MDNEKELRAELMAALATGFLCWEHVPVRHAIFNKHVLVADVVAVPLDPDYAGLTLAFEVKSPLTRTSPKRHLDVPYWTRAIHQASDYVYATIEASSGVEHLYSRRISSAFIFPTTCLRRDYMALDRCNLDYLLRIEGAFEASCHAKVGKASWHGGSKDTKGNLNLSLGNNVWRSDLGFREHAMGILRGKRPLGSQSIDIVRELPGTDLDGRKEQHSTAGLGGHLRALEPA
jgi:hypothetical protein